MGGAPADGKFLPCSDRAGNGARHTRRYSACTVNGRPLPAPLERNGSGQMPPRKAMQRKGHNE